MRGVLARTGRRAPSTNATPRIQGLGLAVGDFLGSRLGGFEIVASWWLVQYLASLFHPYGPNDLAPVEYNLQLPAGDLPRSPLQPEPHQTGFRWGSYDERPSVRERLPGAAIGSRFTRATPLF